MTSEESPLLVDPPIDDESFRHEASSLPSDEQKHVIYAAYSLTLTLSRFFEIISILLMAFSYRRTLIPLTIYSFSLLFASLFHEKLILFVVGSFKSRLNLVNFILFIQRLSMVVFACLLLVKGSCTRFISKLLVFTGLTLSAILLKASLALFQLTFRNDWLRVLSNSQQSVRGQFERLMHGWSTILSLIFPPISGCIVSTMVVTDCSKLLIFLATLGFLVEVSLFRKLYSTCYALHLPRSQFAGDIIDHSYLIESHPMIGVLTTPTISASHIPSFNGSWSNRPLTRILAYIKRKPVPVMVTFGVLLVNVSLITIGPHMVWFLLKGGMSPALVGIVKMLQTLTTLHPSASAPRSFFLTSLGTILAIVWLAALKFSDSSHVWYVRMFAFSVVLARSGIPTITLVGHQFVDDYLADDEVHKLYKENAAWLGVQCEMMIHLLTIIWPHQQQFLWPMLVSATLTFVGMFVVLRVIKMHLQYILRR